MKLLLTLPLLAALSAYATPTVQDLESASSKNQWEQAAETAHEILIHDIRQNTAKWEGARALFQLDLPHSALFFLKRIPREQWANVPQGNDRLAELSAIFRGWVPLTNLPDKMDQLRAENATHYLLGSTAVAAKKYDEANSEFSKILTTPPVTNPLAKSDWGAKAAQLATANVAQQAQTLRELAQLGLARVAYATHQYDKALSFYNSIPANSPNFSRSSVEKIWTIVQLKRFPEALQLTSPLIDSDHSIEAIQARSIRALILADLGKTEDSRREIDRFISQYEKAKTSVEKFSTSQDSSVFPDFIQGTLTTDFKIASLNRYIESLQKEIERLQTSDHRPYPVFSFLAENLEPLLQTAKAKLAQTTEAKVNELQLKLEQLYVQAKLIKAETYLTDREQLRNISRQSGSLSDKTKLKLDTELAELLQDSVSEVDEAIAKTKTRHLTLEFRQAELLWELSGAESTLAAKNGSAPDNEKASGYQRRALRIAQDIVQNAPRFKNYAGALFLAGFAEMKLGQENLGIQDLQNFVKAYPTHSRTADAYRILADDAFDKGNTAIAEGYYKKILSFSDSNLIGYTLYKLGWCAYERNDFPKALQSLEQAVAWSDQWEKSEALSALQREAKRDLISIYAEVGDSHKAPEYFQKFMKGETAPWIIDLAKQLDNSGQYDKSAELYRYLITSDPNNSDNLSYATAIVTGYYKLREWPNVMLSMRQLVDNYRPQLSEATTEEKPPGKTEKVLREVVTTAHAEFQNSKEAADLAFLGEIDELYLSTFSAWPGSEGPLYHHASLLLKTHDYEGAVTAFRNHWNRFNAVLEASVREESLRNLIQALEKIDDREKVTTNTLSAPAAEILQDIAIYKGSYPNSKYIRPITYLGSAIYFKYNQDAKGVTESQFVFDYNPNDSYAKKAFQNLRVAYYKKKDWESTYQWAKEMSARRMPGMQAYADDLKTIRRESLFLWAENTKDDVTAAGLYLDVTKEPDMQSIWAKSYYNAFLRYQKVNHRWDALQVANRLEQLFPSYEGLSQIAGSRAAILQEAGDYVSAYPLLLEMLRSDRQSSPEAFEQARLNTALISEAGGKWSDAELYFHDYLQNAARATPGGVVEAKRGLSRLHFREGRGVASVPPQWERVFQEQAAYQKSPLPSSGSLPERIASGGRKLEALSKELFGASSDPKVSEDTAFEAFCAVPFLYDAYAKSLDELAFTASDSVRKEIRKIATPVAAKAKSLGEECIRKSMEAEHDGPNFRRVNQTWGWEWDPILAQKARAFLEVLRGHYPWAESAPVVETEAALIKSNLTGSTPGDEASWYSLARTRCEQKQYGLCRLTVMDALNRFPNSGRLLNMSAVLQEGTPEGRNLASVFEHAAQVGASYAWANLGVYQLKGGRFTPAMKALTQALEAGVFDSNLQLKTMVKEWTKS